MSYEVKIAEREQWIKEYELIRELTCAEEQIRQLREALKRIAADFECDFVLDGVVVDEPYRMHRVAWEIARTALAATEPKEKT